MRTLKNQTLIYDKDCPLCSVYSSGFIKTKMLDSNGRKAYSALSKEEQNYIDSNRATDEIALVDTKNKRVVYGIDSLLKIIGHSFPFVEIIGTIKPINYGLKKLYAVISYNRKVIIPSKVVTDNTLQCIPTFNYTYRYIYILFATLVTSSVLFNFSKTISQIPESSFIRETAIAFGQIIFQAIFLLKTDNKKTLNYIGNLMTISLAGSLVLIPILLINSIYQLPELALLMFFGLTALLMLYEHIRRVTLLGLPKYVSATWIIYRIIILVILLNI